MLADGPHLAAQPERGDQSAVALRIGPVEILEHAAALADHLEQAAARVVVMLVGGEVLSKILDAARQNGDLHLRRAGIPFVGLILGDDLRFVFRLERHGFRLRPLLNTRRRAVASSFSVRYRRARTRTSLVSRYTRCACPSRVEVPACAEWAAFCCLSRGPTPGLFRGLRRQVSFGEVSQRARPLNRVSRGPIVFSTRVRPRKYSISRRIGAIAGASCRVGGQTPSRAIALAQARERRDGTVSGQAKAVACAVRAAWVATRGLSATRRIHSLERGLPMAAGSGGMGEHLSPEQIQQVQLLIGGYRVSQAIGVVATLGIPDLLMDGPRDSDELAHAIGTHAGALYRVLRLLAGVGLFHEVTPHRFGLTPLGASLRTAIPGSMRPTALMHLDPAKWQAWSQPLHSVRTGETAFPQVHGMEFFDYVERHPESAAIFQQAMTSNTARSGDAITRTYDFSGIRRLVDVGGGHGL